MVNRFAAVIKENRSWLLLAVLFFIGGFLLSYAALQQDPEILKMLEESFLTVLEELGENVFSGSQFAGTVILFFHNLMSVLYVMYLGIIVGLPPLFSALANGSALGLLAFKFSESGISPLPFMAAGILPHGIFELPAFFLAVALGLKLGYHLIFPLPGLSRFTSLRAVFSEIGTSLPFIILLLLIAAAVEVFITPFVISLLF